MIRRKSKPLVERFNAKWMPEPNSGCWLWMGSVQRMGYGHIRIGNGNSKTISAHRLSWILLNGPIPNDSLICHKCDNPACVNPNHLFIGTYVDNMQDCLKKGRMNYSMHVKGEGHGAAKITESMVREIRISSGSIRHDAQKFGLSCSSIWRLRNRHAWKHVV